MSDPKPNEIDLNELDPDRTHTVSELIGILARARAKYGAKSIVRFDAGFNNVSAFITPSKKMKK